MTLFANFKIVGKKAARVTIWRVWGLNSPFAFLRKYRGTRTKRRLYNLDVAAVDIFNSLVTPRYPGIPLLHVRLYSKWVDCCNTISR